MNNGRTNQNADAAAFDLAKLFEKYGTATIFEALQDACGACADHSAGIRAAHHFKTTAKALRTASGAAGLAEASTDADGATLAMGLSVLGHGRVTGAKMKTTQRGGDSMNTAAAVIRDRARKDARFAAAIEQTVADVVAMGLAPPALRERGGRTRIITEAFQARIGEASIPGSAIFGAYPLRAAFGAADVQEIRWLIQKRA